MSNDKTVKHAIPHPDRHKNADGGYDQAKVADTLEMIAGQIRGGHYAMRGMSLVEHPEGGFNGAFHIQHVDPAVEAVPHPDLA